MLGIRDPLYRETVRSSMRWRCNLGYNVRLSSPDPIPNNTVRMITRLPLRILSAIALALIFGVSQADCAAQPIPYGLEGRPLPEARDAESLLPTQVGMFKRGPVEGDLRKDEEVYVTYKSGGREIFLTASLAADREGAIEGVRTAAQILSETYPDRKLPAPSLETEPAFYKVSDGKVSFMAWSRSFYFFSVDASKSRGGLDEFMAAFPY